MFKSFTPKDVAYVHRMNGYVKLYIFLLFLACFLFLSSDRLNACICRMIRLNSSKMASKKGEMWVQLTLHERRKNKPTTFQRYFRLAHVVDSLIGNIRIYWHETKWNKTTTDRHIHRFPFLIVCFLAKMSNNNHSNSSQKTHWFSQHFSMS